ncbi:MAG: plasmid mobilization relaxosome protein MobC [Firmicutes bacterium]|nr:plasmid mobilization relaxosome protein MobC [Bacillota bacterium]
MRSGQRRFKKQVWYTQEEIVILDEKIKKSGLKQSDYFRKCTLDKEIKEKPDKEFYEALKLFRAVSNNLNQIAVKAHKLGFIDELAYKKEVLKLDSFIDDIRTKYIH